MNMAQQTQQQQPPIPDELKLAPTDRSFLKIVQDSFPNTEKPATRFGHLSGYMYDESRPEHEYVGGAEKWVNHLVGSDKYKFPANHEEILRRDAVNMTRSIMVDSTSDSPLHFVSLAPGAAFSTQDIHVVRAFQEATQNGLYMSHSLDINADFADDPRKILSTEFSNLHFSSSSHDLYDESITQGINASVEEMKRKASTKPRRTVAFYSGGTLGNIGLTAKEIEQGYPTRKFADHLKMQIDYEADESYLIISHNAQNDPSVLNNYAGKAHAEFAMHALSRIQFELPTVNFHPNQFYYKRGFDRRFEVVTHSAMSKKDQVFKIGNKEIHVAKGQEACRVGHGFQITNSRMGDLMHHAGLVRIASFGSNDGHTFFQVAKASQKLMAELRKKNNYTP
jgi:hypothetical protein